MIQPILRCEAVLDRRGQISHGRVRGVQGGPERLAGLIGSPLGTTAPLTLV